MNDPVRLKHTILESLSKVIDPETGVDVVRMRLIEDLVVSPDGHVSFKFRPSSPLCPLAVPLSLEIRKVIDKVEGVRELDMEIVGFIQAEELMAWLHSVNEPALEEMLKQKGTIEEQGSDN